MYYVYQLQSLRFLDQKYTGFTTDIEKRLETHNNGQVYHTSKYKPWQLTNYTVFFDEKKARAFAKKHL